MRTHASITIPLSSTRSRTSIRLDPPDTFQQPSEGLLKSLSSCNYFLVERGAGRVELAVAERLVCFLGEEAALDLACADPEAGKARFSRPPTAWVRFGSNFHQFIPICSAL